MAKDLLAIEDAIDQARIFLHGLGMAAEALSRQDKNAIAALAYLVSDQLDEVKGLLDEARKGDAPCAS